MSRFRIDPAMSAMDNLWAAAFQASVHILRTHRFYGFYGQERQDLITDVAIRGVVHFLRFKIRRHQYNREFCFMNNVMSSVWSGHSPIAKRYIRELDTRSRTSDISDIAFSLKQGDGFPRYLGDGECHGKTGRRADFSKLRRVQHKVKHIKEMYEDYVDECKEIGISDIAGIGAWMHRNGYDDPDVMLAMEPKDVQKSMRREHSRIMQEEYGVFTGKHPKDTSDEYFRDMKLDTLLEKSKEYETLYGLPPEGYYWCEYRGAVGLRRIK